MCCLETVDALALGLEAPACDIDILMPDFRIEYVLIKYVLPNDMNLLWIHMKEEELDLRVLAYVCSVHPHTPHSPPPAALF